MGNFLRSSTWMHLFVGLANFCLLEPSSALVATGLSLMWWNFQGVVHEWDHVKPEQKRKEGFNPLTYYGFHALEYLGFLSTDKHQLHHKHDKEHLHDAQAFFDVNAYFAEDWGDKLFSFYKYLATTKYIEGDRIDEMQLKNIASKAEVLGIPVAVAFNIVMFNIIQSLLPECLNT